VTPTATVTGFVKASLTRIEQLPGPIDVTVKVPFVTALSVAMPLQPLTVKVVARGSVMVTVCTCAVPLNVSAAGAAANGPGVGVGVGEGSGAAIPLTTIANGELFPLSSVTVIVASPFATAVIVKTAPPELLLAMTACATRAPAALCSVAGETVATATFEDEALKAP
jgi:hypothetical protein